MSARCAWRTGHDGAGRDLTVDLGIVKWDPPIPADLAGKVRGPRPSWIPATDEERIQNLPGLLDAPAVRAAAWVATEKLDGTSTTVYVDPVDGLEGVCSRNLDLLPTDGNTLWRVAAEHDLHARLTASFPDSRAAVQGETFGEGIPGNPLRLRGQQFRAFTLRVDGAEVPRGRWPEWLLAISVPERPELVFPGSQDDALAQVEKLTSALADRPSEGVVWRAADTDAVTLPDGMTVRASFKVISNRYLVKNDR